MARPARLVAALSTLATVWVACAPAKGPSSQPNSGGASPSASVSAILGASGVSASAFVAPHARLMMIASDRWTPRDVLDLGFGKHLLVGDGGERWLSEESGPPDASVAKLTAAEALASEDLVAVRATKDSGFVFVGRSGTTFAAPKPLAAFVSSRPPPSPLRAIGVGKRAIVGLGVDNVVLRSVDDGVTWSPVAVPKPSGALLQIALDHAGNGLVAMTPQRLFATVDDAATFSVVSSPGIGAARLEVGKGDVVYVEGVGLQMAKDGMVSMKSSPPGGVLRPTPTPHLDVVDPAPRELLRLPLPDDHLWLEYSGAATQGRGVLLGSRWLEVIPDGSGDDNEKLLLVATDLAQIGAAATRVPIAGLGGCLEQYLAGSDKVLVAGCVHDAGDTKGGLPHWTLRLARSDDVGVTWRDQGTIEWNPDAPARRLWITSKGSVLVDGGCLPPRDDKCGFGTTLVRPPGAAKFVRVALPTNTFEIQRLVSTSSGDRIFALATEGTANELRLLTSRDGGKTFTAKPLPELDETALEVADLAIEEDAGKTATVTALVWGGAIVRFSTRDEGTTFEVTKTGLSPTSIALAGKRGLAVGEGSDGFETLDGGRTWGAVSTPRARGLGEWVGVVCSNEGCLIGERAFRVGWEFASPAEVAAAPTSTRPPPKNVFATPLRCTTTPGAIAIGAAEGITPDPGSGLAWHAVRHDGAKGSAVVLQGPRTAPTSTKDWVKEVSLFAPTTSGGFAIAVSSRAEGATAVRYKLERDPGKPGQPGAILKKIVDVEVAWWVAETNQVHHATITAAGELDPYRYTVVEKDGWIRARASAWIAHGGLYVRPFSAKGSEPLFFASDLGKITKLPAQSILPPLSLSAIRTTARTTFIAPTADASGSRQVFVGTLDHGATSWTTRWWGAWPRLEGRFDPTARIGVTTLGNAPLLIVAWPGDARVPAATWGLSLDAPGTDPPDSKPLPTLKDLGDPPLACAATAMTHPRLELPWSTGLRHPVIVSDGSKEFALATTDSIVRLDDKKPSCLSAWSAARASGTGLETAVLLPDDLSHATLFVDKIDKGIHTVFASTMSCAYAKEPLPRALVDARGFVEK